MKIDSVADLIKGIRTPRNIRLDSSVLMRGNDNYHVDVQLSPNFVFQLKELVEDQVKKAIAGRRLDSQGSDGMEQFRQRYQDMITTALHRIKVDLTPDQFNLLQFAVPKMVITEVRARLDEFSTQLEETIAQQRYAGSRHLLSTQERASAFRQQYPELHYRVCRHLLRNLHRVEVNHLRPLREQYLFEKLPEAVNILFNPMLCAQEPDDAALLLDNYGMWSWGRTEFNAGMLALEKFLTKAMSNLLIRPLKSDAKVTAAQSEVFDELGGLFAAQGLLGRADDQETKLSESFCWLEEPGNIRLLFDAVLHEEAADALKEAAGYKVWWKFRADIKKLEKVLDETRKQFTDSTDRVRVILAGYALREEWSEKFGNVIDIAQACRYIAGIDTKKILARVDRSHESGDFVIRKLDELSEEVNRRYKDELDEVWLRAMSDLCRYRLHLKYYRFAHRIFNRLNVISDAEDVHLSRTAGHLNHLLNLEEAQEADDNADPEVVHHSVMRADIRDAVRMTNDLTRQKLNPASYFSTHFFAPVSELLEASKAVKVQVEGDAITLCFYEYNNDPSQWYCVARACGLARQIIRAIALKNANSTQTGVPPLEIGIGISYRADKPVFLYDDDRPIMISAAVAEAHQLATSSKPLREQLRGGPFSVHVLEAPESEGGGQVHHNVDGIFLSNDGFRKLHTEVQLRQHAVKIGDDSHVFYSGRFPDHDGKERELVIREGLVAGYTGAAASEGKFYEIVTNPKIWGHILEQP